MFPWLYQVATAYEQYRFKKLRFLFVSTSASAVYSGSSSTALGAVVLATQYDVYDRPFTTKQQMESSFGATSSTPFRNFQHQLDVSGRDVPYKYYYINQYNQAVGGDLRLYNFATTTIATQGMQAVSSDLGELWIEYEVELIKPKTITGLTISYPAFLMTYYQPAGSNEGGFPGFAYYPTNTLGVTCFQTSNPADDTFKFSQTGYYILTISAKGPLSSQANVDAPTNYFGLTLINIFDQLNDSVAFGETGYNHVYIICFRVDNAASNEIQFGNYVAGEDWRGTVTVSPWNGSIPTTSSLTARALPRVEDNHNEEPSKGFPSATLGPNNVTSSSTSSSFTRSKHSSSRREAIIPSSPTTTSTSTVVSTSQELETKTHPARERSLPSRSQLPK